MRHIFLALTLASSLYPAVASTKPAGAPCNLVDRETLVALKLGAHKTTVHQTKIPNTTPPQIIDACTFTPQGAALPALTVSVTVLPSENSTIKPSCQDQSLPQMQLSICNMIANKTSLSFALATPASSDAAMKSTFRSHVERLFKGLAGAGAQKTAAK